MEIKSAIVTGGGGFIGSHLVDALVQMDVDVAVIDNWRSGRESNLEAVKDKITIYNYDIRDENCRHWFEYHKPDVVFHLAAIPGVSYSVDNVRESDSTNVNGTANMLELSRDYGVKRFIFSSSSSVYGGISKGGICPTTAQLWPQSPYALQKKIGEDYCKLFYKKGGLETVALRYFNIFGPRQYGDSPYAAVIAAFADSIKNNTTPKIHGDGEQYRDFTYIDNVVSANILAATRDSYQFEAFDIGCGEKTTVNQLHNLMNCAPAEYIESRKGDVRASQASIKPSEDFLGYQVKVSLEDGLKKTIEWYLNE